MALLTPDQVVDLVTNTTREFKRGKWVDISLQYQEYVSGEIITKDKVVEQGGTAIQWQLQVANTGTAVNSGLYAEDVTAVDDVTIDASVPWSKQVVSWSFDVDEDLFQSDKETIVQMLMIREHAALNKMHELNEINLWTSPSGTSDKRPMGIPFWLQKNTSVPGGGFTGGNPSAFSAGRGGVSSTTYPNWRNWAFQYAAVSPDDLVVKLKRALRYTKFIPPDPHPQLGFSGVDYVIYTTYNVIEPLERIAENRNDKSLGPDVARYLNRVTVGGVPLRDVPYLTENDSSNPIYGVNKRDFRPFLKKGCDKRRSKPIPAPKQHTVRNVFIDTWMGYMAINLRSQFVGSTA